MSLKVTYSCMEAVSFYLHHKLETASSTEPSLGVTQRAFDLTQIACVSTVGHINIHASYTVNANCLVQGC